jgi:hypothetical protein
LAEARRQGVRRTLVTHATTAPVLMSVEQMQHATRLGASIELVGGSVASPEATARLNRLAGVIRQVGPRNVVLSSDLGRSGNPAPVDGLAAFLLALRATGFTQEEIALMSRVNPARLLGLSPAS